MQHNWIKTGWSRDTLVFGDDDDMIRALFVDQVMVFFKGLHDNEVTAHDWSHLNDTRLQIFGWYCMYS